MPTSYTDQFFLIDPYSPPPAGTTMNFSVLTITDQNDDNDFDQNDNDSVNGIDISGSYAGDTVTINVPGVGNVTYQGVTFYMSNGARYFTPNDGQVLQNGTLVSTTWVSPQGPLLVSELGPPCFVAGTLIETANGPRAVQDITVGDLVMTLDNGLQPVRWHGRRTVQADGKMAPIRFAPGAIGNDRELLVSPQHRMLITGWRAELFFGEDEVLVAATHLVNGDTINRVRMRQVSYHHLMFDHHEVIFAQDVPTESFYPGDMILDGDPELCEEISALFPEMMNRPSAAMETARCVLRGNEARVLGGEACLAA